MKGRCAILPQSLALRVLGNSGDGHQPLSTAHPFALHLHHSPECISLVEREIDGSRACTCNVV